MKFSNIFFGPDPYHVNIIFIAPHGNLIVGHDP